VDLASVVAETQRGFAERVAKGETQAALDEAARAGLGLSRAVQRLARECAASSWWPTPWWRGPRT
jgi:hypothetical protein